MSSTEKVHNTLIGADLEVLHGAVLDIVAVMNRPQRDEVLIREAGIPLDRALFPLLVRIERAGPIGVTELADRVGRDYTTVSRQVAKLEGLGLAERRDNPGDRRLRAVVATPKGKGMTDRVDAARERLLAGMLADWTPEELDAFVRLARRFADALRNGAAPAGGVP